jgi:lipoprotein-anchoring transpeptidase ErfK/SrfK
MNNSASLLQAAQQAIKSGQRQQARELLHQVIRLDPDQHRAWLWLAGLAPSPKISLGYIARAAAIKPDDPAVKKARAWAEARLTALPAAPALPVTATSPLAVPAPTPAAAPVTIVAPAAAKAATAVKRNPNKAQRSRRFLIAFTAGLVLIALALSASLFWLMADGRTPSVAASVPNNLLLIETALSTPITGDNEASNQQPHGALVDAPTALPTSTVMPTARPSATAEPVQPKAIAQIIVENSNEAIAPLPTWTLTPVPSPTPTPSPTFAPTALSANTQVVTSRPSGVAINERWIDVNLSTQTLTAYEGNQAVRSTLISSGRANTPTVTGSFRIYVRYRSQDMDGYRLGFNYYLKDVPYVQYFYGNYGLHGTYWHNNFGTPMSHGCVNLPTPEAEWLFNWAGIGTLVYVHY